MEKRNVHDVLSKVLELIPDEAPFGLARRQLANTIRDIAYTPPECYRDIWVSAMRIMNTHFAQIAASENPPAWVQKTIDLFNGKVTIEEV